MSFWQLFSNCLALYFLFNISDLETSKGQDISEVWGNHSAYSSSWQISQTSLDWKAKVWVGYLMNISTIVYDCPETKNLRADRLAVMARMWWECWGGYPIRGQKWSPVPGNHESPWCLGTCQLREERLFPKICTKQEKTELVLHHQTDSLWP